MNQKSDKKVKPKKNNKKAVAKKNSTDTNKKNGLKKADKTKVKLAILIISVLIVIYIIIAVINLLREPADTFMVENGKVCQEETTIGYIIREEKIIKGDNYKNGIITIKGEGEKVSKNASVFRYYSNNEEKLVEEINELNVKIDEALANSSNVPSGDEKALEKQIEGKIDGIWNFNDVQKIQEYKKDINSYMTKKAKIAGELSASGSYIKDLIEQRNNYEKELNVGSEELKSAMSGIVSYRVDGLEEVLNPSDFTNLSKNLLEGLNIKTGQIVATSTEAGKVVNNFNCYIATILGSQNAIDAKVDDKVEIRLSNQNELKAQIVYKAPENDNEYVIVFKIEECVEELVNYRKISTDIIWWSEDGLKVPNSAIIYDEELAYVIRNRAGYLDKILVKKIIENRDYSIVKSYTTEELKELEITNKSTRNLALYDEILLHPDFSKLN